MIYSIEHTMEVGQVKLTRKVSITTKIPIIDEVVSAFKVFVSNDLLCFDEKDKQLSKSDS